RCHSVEAYFCHVRWSTLSRVRSPEIAARLEKLESGRRKRASKETRDASSLHSATASRQGHLDWFVRRPVRHVVGPAGRQLFLADNYALRHHLAGIAALE